MSNINWSKLLDIKYWLEGIAGNTSLTPIIPINSFFYFFYIYLFGGLLIVGIIILVINQLLNQKNPLRNRLPFLGNNLFWMGCLGIIWFLFRQTQVGFLGARIWIIFGFVWFVTVLYFTLRYFLLYSRLEMQYYIKLQKELDTSKKKSK